jgi:hypothetical protein
MALVNALVTSSDCKIQLISSYTEPDNGPHWPWYPASSQTVSGHVALRTYVNDMCLQFSQRDFDFPPKLLSWSISQSLFCLNWYHANSSKQWDCSRDATTGCVQLLYQSTTTVA